MLLPTEFHTHDGQAPLALVTGGARRIGADLVRSLAADGFRVAIHCNNSQAEAETLRQEIAASGAPEPVVLVADLALPDIGNLILSQLTAPIRVLVNNASLFEEDRLGAIDPALWQRQMAVNLLAPALLTEAMANFLPPGQSGLVVNFLDAKLSAPNPDYFSYTVSKFGLAGVTELSARQLASHGIRVNAIAPSVTLVSGPQSRSNFEQAHVMNPLKRGVDAAHLVSALHYLVHTPTVTGQTLSVDSGQRFLALPRDVAYMIEP